MGSNNVVDEGHLDEISCRVDQPVRIMNVSFRNDEIRGRYLLTDNSLPQYFGQADFSMKDNASPGYFMVMRDPQNVIFGDFYGSHNYLFYYDETKIKEAESLRLEKVILHAYKSFIGQE